MSENHADKPVTQRQAVTLGAIGVAAALAGSVIGGTAAANTTFERHAQAQPVSHDTADSADNTTDAGNSTKPILPPMVMLHTLQQRYAKQAVSDTQKTIADKIAAHQDAAEANQPKVEDYRATQAHAQEILALTDTPAGAGLQPATAEELHATGVRPIHVAPNVSSQVIGVTYQADCSTIGIGGINPNATPAQFVHANEVRRAAEAQRVVDDEGNIWYPVADTSLWIVNDGFCV